MGSLSKSMFILQEYLDSIRNRYEVKFFNEPFTDILHVRVTKDHRTIIGDVDRLGLTDERYLIDEIEKLIIDLERNEL